MKKLLSLRKNKKGFTMVELLVVLVIIVILMAAIIPSMLGFIDKAKEETILAECRNVQLSADVKLNELYGLSASGSVTQAAMTGVIDEVKKIAGVTGTINAITLNANPGTSISSIEYTPTGKSPYLYEVGKGWVIKPGN